MAWWIRPDQRNADWLCVRRPVEALRDRCYRGSPCQGARGAACMALSKRCRKPYSVMTHRVPFLVAELGADVEPLHAAHLCRACAERAYSDLGAHPCDVLGQRLAAVRVSAPASLESVRISLLKEMAGIAANRRTSVGTAFCDEG